MGGTIDLPVWVVVLVGILAALSLMERALIPSVRWFIRRRAERIVARLNTNLERPIEPFKLARRHDMIQRLIYHPDVAQAVAEHVTETGDREDVAFEKARRYAREIVPSFSAFAYFTIGTKGAGFIARSLYRVRLAHYDESLADVDPNTTVIFVMNHRSNLDYVLVTYLAAERSALSYAVGEWARIWPLSKLIRSMGGYFIRRKSRNALYRAVLARYVEMATQGGVTQAIFPEGGLSLDGRLAPPKLGLLDYVVRGADLEARDVLFVPVALNYDRVLEDRILMSAGEKGERRFRPRIKDTVDFVAKQIWLRITGGFHRNGYAAVSFGAPVSLRELGGISTEDLAQRLMQDIGAVVPVVPVPLVCQALLSGAQTREDIYPCCAKLLEGLKGSTVHLPRDSLTYAVEVGLRMLRLRHVISEGTPIEIKDRDILEFYAQSIEHLIVAPKP
ncbi:MAG: 1-acyl-sn-glycerol-3-phosphate acyltransferase [Pseudomonadota bacterium]